jgi:hypothetical protein
MLLVLSSSISCGSGNTWDSEQKETDKASLLLLRERVETTEAARVP